MELNMACHRFLWEDMKEGVRSHYIVCGADLWVNKLLFLPKRARLRFQNIPEHYLWTPYLK